MDYFEKQYLNLLWLKLLMAMPFIICYFVAGYGVYDSITNGTSSQQFWIAIPLVIGMTALPFWLIFGTAFTLLITSKELKYVFFPYVRNEKCISFTEIGAWKIIQINALNDFGGWGYRKKLGGNRTGFIMGSKDGIELHLQNGKVIVMSTQNVFQVSETLKKYMPTLEIK